MAIYDFKCTNEKCDKKDEIISESIPIKEYSEDKFPICESCGEKTERVYSGFAFQTFGDSPYLKGIK